MQWGAPVCVCVVMEMADVAGSVRTSRGTCCMQWGAPVWTCVVMEMGDVAGNLRTSRDSNRWR